MKWRCGLGFDDDGEHSLHTDNKETYFYHVLNSLYGRLNLNLVKANATAMLSRCFASDMYTV